jgi:hypothetical protein
LDREKLRGEGYDVGHTRKLALQTNCVSTTAREAIVVQ